MVFCFFLSKPFQDRLKSTFGKSLMEFSTETLTDFVSPDSFGIVAISIFIYQIKKCFSNDVAVTCCNLNVK